MINTSSQSPKPKWTRLTHTAAYIAKKIKKLTERTNYILDTLSIKYIQQAFTDASRNQNMPLSFSGDCSI